MTDAEALAASGDAVVPLLHYRQMNEESAAASVRALRLVGTDYAQLVLKGYFGDRRPAVVDELTQAVNPLFLEVVREQLEKNGKLSEAIARQISDLGPIASMSNLEQLDLTGWDSLHDIAPLAELRNLKRLTLPRKKILSLKPLYKTATLEYLSVLSPGKDDITSISKCTSLTKLHVSTIDNETMEAISSNSQLETLHISDSNVIAQPPADFA